MTRFRSLLASAAVIAILAPACGPGSANPYSQVVPESRSGTTAPTAPAQPSERSAEPTEVGPTPLDEPVQFTVSLTMPGAADIAGFLESLNDPRSPNYRDFLTPDQFGRRFGLGDDAVARVVTWLEDAGISVRVAPQRTSIAASGTAAQVNELLQVGLVDWKSADGERFHRPSSEPSIPAGVAAEVAAVLGLDTEPVIRPAFRGRVASGVPGDGLEPATVAKAYEIDGLHAQGLHGEGQTVAIISFDTFTPSDVDRFDQRYALSAPPVEIVRIPGAAEVPGPGTAEVALDIHVVRGIAPQAQIINYEGPNGADAFVPVVSRIVADGRANIISISWGLCENYSLRSSMEAEEREFAAAFAAGISVFASSGDDGAYDCRRIRVSDDPFDRDLSIAVNWPASSPSVVGVGGTFLSTLEDGTYLSEAGWEDPLGGSGGGGGVSRVNRRPSWQTGAGVDNSNSNGNRQVPDVAGPADPLSGFLVVFTDPDRGLVSGRVGGTSAAAPFWAGSMALASQLATSSGVAQVGPLGPTLYAISAEQPTGAVFHDVIRGGNLLFSAGPGWDYSTGLGTPRVTPLARAIVEFLTR